MTEQEWKRRSVDRILRAVKKAGRVCVRDLKRATHYNRGPVGGSIPVWYDALDRLEKSKQVVIERNEHGEEAVIMLPQVAKAMGYDSRGRRMAQSVSD